MNTSDWQALEGHRADWVSVPRLVSTRDEKQRAGAAGGRRWGRESVEKMAALVVVEEEAVAALSRSQQAPFSFQEWGSP